MSVSGACAPGGSNTTSVRPAPLSVQLVPRPTARLVLLLGVLVALGPFTIDMYLPALPVIAPDLGSTPAVVQLTLTGTLVGVAAGQLVIGPLSDALGRRRPLVAGVAVHVVASVLCVLAPSVAVLGVLRAFQGFGAAAASVVGMAVVRDLFSGRAAATLFSRLMLVIGASPVLAPTVGGEVLRWSSGGASSACSRCSGPASSPWRRGRCPRRCRRIAAGAGGAGAVRTYAALLGDRAFAGLALVGRAGDGVPVRVRLRLDVRLPESVRTEPAGVRPGVRVGRRRPDRGHAAHGPPASPVDDPSDPCGRIGPRHRLRRGARRCHGTQRGRPAGAAGAALARAGGARA